MSTNPIKTRQKSNDGIWLEKWLTAAEMAAVARENGDGKKAKLWTEKALEMGQELIPPGWTVRFVEGSGKQRVRIGNR